MTDLCSRLTLKGPILSTVLEWSIQSLFSSQNLTLVFQHGRCLTNAELSDIMTHINNSHLCIRVDDNKKKGYNGVFTTLLQNKVLVLIERWCVKMLAVKGPTESGRWWWEGGQEIGVRSAVRWTNYGNTDPAHVLIHHIAGINKNMEISGRSWLWSGLSKFCVINLSGNWILYFSWNLWIWIGELSGAD